MQIYYPNNYVLPDGNLWTFCDKFGEIIETYTGKVLQKIPAWKDSHRMEYPYTGTTLMLALTPENNYTPEIVQFGGQYGYGWINTTASNKIERIKAVYDSATGSYDFGESRV
jgi:hypothetical protein